MSIKAVIFDMDGVLIDAKEWHYNALNKALGLFGFTVNPYEHIIGYDGLPTKDKLKRLSIEKKLPEYLHAFINEMKQIYTVSMIHQYCRPRFIHEYALSKLKAEGYKLAVASNSIRQTVDLMMEKSYLQHYFDLTLSNQDVRKAKPDSEIYTTAIERLNLTPQECLILEDNENGIKAAIASGANLLIIENVAHVNYNNIRQRINEIESKGI